LDFLFDVVFNGVSAWTQIGYFIMAFAFSGIGGGLIGYELYWRFKADRVKARISSVRVTGEKKESDKRSTGETYYSVFEYSAPNGEVLEHMSDMGSNSLLSQLPGKRVTLMVFPDSPGKVRRPSLVLPIFGSVFLLPGIFIGHMAVTTFEPSSMFFIIIIAIIGFIAYKIWDFVKDIPREELKEGWRSLRENKPNITSSSRSENEKGRVLEQDEIFKRLKNQCRNSRISGYIMLVVACALVGGSYYAGLNMVDRMQNGVRAPAEVVRIKSQYSSSTDSSGYTYYAIVGFTDENGRSVEFKDSVGASSPMYKTGDEVEVIYYFDKPKDAIIDRGIFNWSLSGGLAIGGLLILWMAIYSIRISRRFGHTKDRTRV